MPTLTPTCLPTPTPSPLPRRRSAVLLPHTHFRSHTPTLPHFLSQATPTPTSPRLRLRPTQTIAAPCLVLSLTHSIHAAIPSPLPTIRAPYILPRLVIATLLAPTDAVHSRSSTNTTLRLQTPISVQQPPFCPHSPSSTSFARTSDRSDSTAHETYSRIERPFSRLILFTGCSRPKDSPPHTPHRNSLVTDSQHSFAPQLSSTVDPRYCLDSLNEGRLIAHLLPYAMFSLVAFSRRQQQ
jgi:hypothetical protein